MCIGCYERVEAVAGVSDEGVQGLWLTLFVSVTPFGSESPLGLGFGGLFVCLSDSGCWRSLCLSREAVPIHCQRLAFRVEDLGGSPLSDLAM